MRPTKKRILQEEVKAAVRHPATPPSEPPEPLQFECMICGSDKYDGVYVRSGFETIGGTIYPTAYKCKDCSVMFGDPVLFSKKEKEAK